MARNKDASEPKTGVAGWNESVGISSRSSASGSRHGKVVADRKRRIAFLVLLLILCIASHHHSCHEKGSKYRSFTHIV